MGLAVGTENCTITHEIDEILAALDNLKASSTVVVRELNKDSAKAISISSQILSIIFDYALNKFDDTEQRHRAGTPKFLSVIDKFVAANQPVKMCLPAFPFKSANKVYKVFGILPDKAEELALERLNTMCLRIGEVYTPSAEVKIISDGLVYNDLFSIPDRETWAYGEALRALAADKNFNQITFSRLKDLVNFPLPENLGEISYVANATNFRRHLLNRFGKDDLDIEHEIATNPDTLMTYQGYCRFLQSDLQYIFPTGENRSRKSYQKDVKYIAKQMLTRGYAFAGAVKSAFPNHLRLSIHRSTGEHKISMSLLNTKTGFTTPWHCSVALMADGEWISSPMGEFNKDPNLEIVNQNGRPSYFREKNYTVRKAEPVTGDESKGHVVGGEEAVRDQKGIMPVTVAQVEKSPDKADPNVSNSEEAVGKVNRSSQTAYACKSF